MGCGYWWIILNFRIFVFRSRSLHRGFCSVEVRWYVQCPLLAWRAWCAFVTRVCAVTVAAATLPYLSHLQRSHLLRFPVLYWFYIEELVLWQPLKDVERLLTFAGGPAAGEKKAPLHAFFSFCRIALLLACAALRQWGMGEQNKCHWPTRNCSCNCQFPLRFCVHVPLGNSAFKCRFISSWAETVANNQWNEDEGWNSAAKVRSCRSTIVCAPGTITTVISAADKYLWEWQALKKVMVALLLHRATLKAQMPVLLSSQSHAGQGCLQMYFKGLVETGRIGWAAYAWTANHR